MELDFIKPFKELVALTKEGVDAALAIPRAKLAKISFDKERAELEEQKISGENKLVKLCTEKEPNVKLILDTVDDIAIAERRIEQIDAIIAKLFPTETA